ncbi:MAG: oxygen-dependent coproporphyrinogen oxidase [Bacteroidota bacterium]
MKVSRKDEFTAFIKSVQQHICDGIEQHEPTRKFVIDDWKRDGFGYGSTRVLSDGDVIEKGGVNISVVGGELPESLRDKLGVEDSEFFACGISLVIHPKNPFAPTVHANYRYFEMYDKETKAIKDQWFGGGADLTPYYLFPEDAIHFHTIHKDVCDQFDDTFYSRFKSECDAYFFNHHRNESRGIGGLFFDYLRPTDTDHLDHLFSFCKTAGYAFTDAYLPILSRRKDMTYTPENRYWQELRRGRYVEFNLIHDRGTLFGLKTKGRIESILMSLPPRVRWDYDTHPETGTPEAELLAHLRPVDWINLTDTET